MTLRCGRAGYGIGCVIVRSPLGSVMLNRSWIRMTVAFLNPGSEKSLTLVFCPVGLKVIVCLLTTLFVVQRW